MERVIVLVLLALSVMNAAETAQDNLTTLGDLFHERFQLHLHEFSFKLVENWRNYFLDNMRNTILNEIPWKAEPLPFSKKIDEYIKTLVKSIVFEGVTILENVTLKSIYQDLNDYCSAYLETPIVDLRNDVSNTTCPRIRLEETLGLKYRTGIEAGLLHLSRLCIQKELDLCSSVKPNCTLAYEERIGQVLSSLFEDINDVQFCLSTGSFQINFISKFALKMVDGTTLLDDTTRIMIQNSIPTELTFTFFNFLMTVIEYTTSSAPSIEPFTLENLLNPWADQVSLLNNQRHARSQNELMWGIVKSRMAILDFPCSYYKETYSPNTDEFCGIFFLCYVANILQSNIQLLTCAFSDPNSEPLAWSSAPSIYVSSQCLCLLSNGSECGVKESQNIDTNFYCLSALLRDLQRQIVFRPAVTYLDYAFQTRVPVCKLHYLLKTAFLSECDDPINDLNLDFILSGQCYFKDLVNKDLNCTETLLLKTYNHTVLCSLLFFMEFVLCDDDSIEVRVLYYGAGDSTLVLGLTYVNVAVTVLTLVTYTICPQLRNLPGKLLMGYQVTTLTRLLSVRATLVHLAVAVRLDVALEFSSTLWLTAYLHFLTVCIMSLRPPNSLRPDEARLMLRRYVAFGWGLPAALSVVFFSMDDALDSRVQFGQLCFVFCNCVALFANGYMFYKNCNFYYDVRRNARIFQVGVTKRRVLLDLLNFAIKTSLLSGAGIILRLVMTQIQGLEHLLGYYHVLGTLQGLLLFALYGCNREARAFWLRVVRSVLNH